SQRCPSASPSSVTDTPISTPRAIRWSGCSNYRDAKSATARAMLHGLRNTRRRLASLSACNRRVALNLSRRRRENLLQRVRNRDLELVVATGGGRLVETPPQELSRVAKAIAL